MYVRGCEQIGPTGRTGELTRLRVLSAPIRVPLFEHRGDTKTAAAPDSCGSSRWRSCAHPSSREYHVPTV